MAFWGVEVKPGRPFTYSLDKSCGRLRISQATLGIGASNNKSLVQCNVGKKSPVLLCSLLPDKAESCHMELEFQEAEEVTFSVIGPRSVHLTGYFLASVRWSADANGDSESYGEDIRETETERSDDFHDDEYEDSFIDDGDLEVSHLSPSPCRDNRGKKKTNNKKSDRRNIGLKRLKKKYKLSESEDEVITSKQNTGNDHIHDLNIASEADDQIPISSLNGRINSVDGDSKRKGNHVADLTTVENQSEERKTKRKKRKSNKEDEGPSRILPSGLAIEELEIGKEDGKLASSGMKVTIHYTGKVKEGGQVFDSTTGRDPLKFRLGKGRALEGLDLGIQGMRVGGKRRLLIPPTLGFGSEGSERVPRNSWLIMDVELLRAR